MCLRLGGQAAVCAPPDETPVVMPPWVIEERVERPLQTARDDWFAATLGPTSVVGASTWSGRSIATLAEALRQAPGVMLQESFGGFEPPRLSIRGSGLDSAPTSRGVALLVDGLPLARADGSFHSGLFDPLLFSRVEFYRGTMHMALTPAVLGGVLHAVTRSEGRAGGPAFRLEAGDFGAWRANVSYGAPRVRIAGARSQARGWRDHSEQERRALEAALRHAISAGTHLDFSVYAAAADYEVPGPLTLADATLRPRTISAAAWRDRPRRSSNIVRPSFQVRSTGRDGSVAAGFAVQRLRDDFFQLQANGETDSTSDDVTAHTTLSRRIAFGELEHQLLARGTFSGGENRVARFLNDRSQRGAPFGKLGARADTGALSVEDLVWLRPNLALGAGATALRAERKLYNRDTGTAIARSLRFADVSPRGGVTWHADERASLHGAVSRGIEPPSFDDLVSVAGTFPNLSLRSRELRAQRATTFEVGGSGRVGSLGWNITGYRAGWSDEILRLADAAGQPRGAVNAGPTIHEGIETSLRWTNSAPPHRWTLGATSTLGHFRFDSDPVYGDNRIAGAPPHTGNAELSYEHTRGFFAALEATWSAGRTWVDHAGRLGYGGQGLLHARVGWRRNERFTVFLSCRNLLDRAHVASTAGVLDLARSPAATAIFLPGTGRGFSVGVEWKP